MHIVTPSSPRTEAKNSMPTVQHLTVEACIAARFYPAGDTVGPAIVLCPGFTGTQGAAAIVAAAQAFAKAGVHALTFDYRSFGDSGGEPRQEISVSRQLADIRTVLQHLRGMPTVEPDRVALWGSCLGGGHAVTIAGEDPRIFATVAQAPYNGIPNDSGKKRLENYKAWFAEVRRQPPPLRLHVQVVAETAGFSVFTQEEVGVNLAEIEGATWRNEVAVRGLSGLAKYTPSDSADRIRGPILVCAGLDDTATPYSTLLAITDRAPKGTGYQYGATHFGMYQGNVRKRALATQVRFVLRALRQLGHDVDKQN